MSKRYSEGARPSGWWHWCPCAGGHWPDQRYKHLSDVQSLIHDDALPSCSHDAAWRNRVVMMLHRVTVSGNEC